MTRSLAILSALAVFAAVPAHAGPPWISIECPANPHHPSSRAASFMIRTYHHSTAIPGTLSGTAEGLVNGERRSIPLRFGTGPGAGIYVVSNDLPTSGAWILVITSGTEQEGATALVELAEARVVGVEVPHRTTRDGWKVPRPVSDAEIEAALRKHATQLAQASRRSTLGLVLAAIGGMLFVLPVAVRTR